MQKGPYKILAVDSASCLGWAVGMSNEEPRSGFIHLGGVNATPAGRFSGALKWMNKMMDLEKPDIVAVEAPFLNPVKTSMTQLRMSHGLLGCIQGIAQMRGCFRVVEINGNSVKTYFINAPPKKKGEKVKPLDGEQKKLLIRRRCIELGWTTEDDTNLDQTDACAVWAMAVGQYDQPNSIRFSPLFQKA